MTWSNGKCVQNFSQKIVRERNSYIVVG